MKNNLMTQEEAEEYSASIAKLGTGVDGTREIIEHAVYTLRIHKTFGIEPEEWVEQTIGYPRLDDAKERRDAVKLLSDNGKSQRQIAMILGIHRVTVERDLAVLKVAAQAAIEAPKQGDSEPEVPTQAGSKKKSVEEQRPEIRDMIDEGKSDAQIALALGRGVATIGKERATYKKEREAIAKTAPRPRSNVKRKITEAEAKAMLDGRLARVELAALHLLAWWEQEGQAALTTDLGWIDENIAHTEEKVTMIFQSVRGLKTDADDALAQWTAEAEGRSEA